VLNNPFTNVTVRQLKRALAIKQRIDKLERELAAITNNAPPSLSARGTAPRRRRRLSAAARAKIAAAARARWARFRAAKGK